jgi:hypothetical protein
MATHKAGRWTYSDAELTQMFEASDQRGQAALQTEVQARTASYDAITHRLNIELKSRATLSIPCERLQGLNEATPADIAAVELGLRGASLHWEKLDLDFSVSGLVQGIFGTRKWMDALAQADTQVQTSKSGRRKAA